MSRSIIAASGQAAGPLSRTLISHQFKETLDLVLERKPVAGLGLDILRAQVNLFDHFWIAIRPSSRKSMDNGRTLPRFTFRYTDSICSTSWLRHARQLSMPRIENKTLILFAKTSLRPRQPNHELNRPSLQPSGTKRGSLARLPPCDDSH